ncbi:MAG TPA: AsmA-like C-terminal region-containing protein [Rhizobiaceae bacterium]
MPTPLLRRSLWALAVAAGLILLAALALPYAASTRLVRDHIAHEMSEWSGFDVTIAAAPEISVWPDLQADLIGVTLSPPGSRGAPTITAERMEIELSPLAALGGDVEFSRARFIRPTIRIENGAETGASALTNGGRIARAIETARQIVAENRAAPDSARLPAEEFGVIEFSDGEVVEVSGATETVIASGLAGRVDWEELDGRASAKATGTWRGEKFTLDLGSANPLLFLGGGAAPVTLNLKSAPANLTFDGTASLGQHPYVDGRMSFSAPSVRRTLEWLRTGLLHESTIGSVAMESRVMGDAQRLRFEDAEITLDGKPARGALDLLFTGKLPMVAGTLAFDTLDLWAFLSAFTPLEPSVGSGPGIIDADFASRLNLDLRLSARQATVGTIALADLAATARVDEALAAFDISDASAFGGNIQAGLRFDREATGSRVEMRLLATDIEGDAFAAAAGLPLLAPVGRGTVSLILKGDGSSWDSLLAHANGSFSANFGRGRLSGIDLAALLARSKDGLPFTLEEVKANASPIDALDLKANIVDGVARIEKAELRWPGNRITVTGVVPLGEGVLDLSGKAEVPQAAATADPPPDAVSFLVGGPWTAPVVTPTTQPQPE